MYNFENFKMVLENFKDKSFPEILKKVSNIIRKDITVNKNNSFNKHYIIDSFDINIVVDYKYGNKKPYYSNINIYNILTKPEDTVDIIIKVEDIQIDIDYLMSIIMHEIRHIYDIYTIADDIEINEFLKVLTISKFMNTKYINFVHLVYLSLEHELIARHNMLYDQFRWINITDKNQLFEIFKKTFTYKSLINLKEFDSSKFVNETDKYDLLIFTKNFITKIKDETKCDTINMLFEYYKKWDVLFKKKSDEYLTYVDDMLDDVINDIKSNKVYERLNGMISYNENIGNKISLKIFDKILENKNSNF